MSRNQLLKRLLLATRPHWDHPGVRAEVRANFNKVLICQTSLLGAEVYASATEMKIVPHTCKSRMCPSCGYRNTLLWQRELWTLLPDIPYAGIVFTMPDVLWPIFEQNRHLLRDLPALGAAITQRHTSSDTPVGTYAVPRWRYEESSQSAMLKCVSGPKTQERRKY